MLILQRKVGETILLNDDIKISVLEISADKVKLAIDAPREVNIVRKELIDAVNNNIEAMVSPKSDSISSLKNLLVKK